MRIFLRCVHACGFLFLMNPEIKYGITGKNRGNHVKCIHMSGVFDTLGVPVVGSVSSLSFSMSDIPQL